MMRMAAESASGGHGIMRKELLAESADGRELVARGGAGRDMYLNFGATQCQN